MTLPAPSPIHLLRSHSCAVSTLFISADNERLYSGDGSGQVVVTYALFVDTRILESSDALLERMGISNHNSRHAKDNKIHIWGLWARSEESTFIRQGPATLSELLMPVICYSMDVNACNYCRFSLIYPAGTNEQEGLLAVPNLVESALADIWSLPSRQRLHAAIDGRSGSKTGTIMSMHLFYAASSAPSSSTSATELRLLCAYEDGCVVLRKRTAPKNIQTIESQSVMAMAVSCVNSFKTKHPGNDAITIRDDGRVCAVGGWDGKEDSHSSDEDEMTVEEKCAPTRWLIAGSTDAKVSIWELMNFDRTRTASNLDYFCKV
ncbi:hypothetical protein K503DRAFT_791528 [Rhizopogon vinicolor AM-OR11-026]|uniref:WD40 repeat-like protein n=1 Tax=Rhizopogon vinicolor AM-OR11-026 TaxID=1314800 RepID=A0A1B7N5R2_9AGAM|nr:hypothetical protein K503DRAFT_791528 [Rhizopogon vinicolor AM-OR11-026]